MQAALALVVLTLALGLGPARLLSRSRATILVLAPGLAAVACAVAVPASIHAGGSMIPWLVALAVIGWAASLRLRPMRRPAPAGAPPGESVDDLRILAGAALAAIVPLLLVRYPTTTADARSIWWLHAAWFHSGGNLAREAMTNPVLPDIHPSYPPLIPGVIASVWHLWRPYDREMALATSQWLTAYGATALGYFTARAFRLHGWAATAAAAGIAWLGWSAKVDVGLSGLVDLTWALFLVTAAVLLLTGDLDRRTVAVGALFATLAALSKTEAQAAVLLLVLVTLFRGRSAWRPAVAVAAASAGATMLWATVIRPGEADRGDPALLADVFDRGSVAHDRLSQTVDRLASELGPFVAVAALAVVALIVVGRATGRPLRQPGLLSMLVLGATYLVVIALTFAVRPDAIDLLLDVTAYRTVIVVRLLVWIALALAVAAACQAARPAAGPSEPDPVVTTDAGPPRR